MEEIWKKIKGHETYEVSNLGRVKSLKYGKERILKPVINNHGYAFVNLYSGSGKVKTIHRLVAAAFLGESELQVNHKDGEKLNNALDNLEYVSNRDNVAHFHKSKSDGYTSRFIGVSWHKGKKKWQARISIKGKVKHLGRFKTEEDAHKAYLDALKRYGIEGKYT